MDLTTKIGTIVICELSSSVLLFLTSIVPANDLEGEERSTDVEGDISRASETK